MNNTYRDGERIRVHRLGKYQVEKGDIVIFTAPNGEEKVSTNKVYKLFGKKEPIRYIKRVVAVPGERVKVKEGKVYVEGVEKTKVKKDDILDVEYKLDEGNYFLLGDNRQSSEDSRYFGPVNQSEFFGRVMFPREGDYNE